MTWPFASIGWVTSLVQKASASQTRINAFSDVKPDIASPENPVRNGDIEGRIAFRHVGLTYPDSGITALDGVDFTLEPGQTLAVIGRTGSGKSTLAQLVARLYDPTEGEVLIDGVPFPTTTCTRSGRPSATCRRTCSCSRTPSGPTSASARTRRTPLPSSKPPSMRTSTTTSSGFPEGYDTLLGERGVNLSGGQKQRISIARAILKRPRILIFDDCLSAVDTETEATILGNLRRIMDGRTSILISHRVSTVRSADLILVLDGGRIVERGDHDTSWRRMGCTPSCTATNCVRERKRIDRWCGQQVFPRYPNISRRSATPTCWSRFRSASRNPELPK